MLLETADRADARRAPRRSRANGCKPCRASSSAAWTLTRLYPETEDPAHLRTARRFDHEKPYAPPAAGRDELAGRHADAGTVPGYEARTTGVRARATGTRIPREGAGGVAARQGTAAPPPASSGGAADGPHGA
ncbi:glycoside hydrolase family 127 protein, partial [Streptomyces sp. TRM76130]|nr:glycoside hydrolase family 127 protein [Streptomyces sp. TRM76130]